MLSIIGVGVALAVLIFGLFSWLRSDMAKGEERGRQRFDLLQQQVRDSERRIIVALVNHRHPEPAGEPVFTEPV